jgi:hypothetical protein
LSHLWKLSQIPWDFITNKAKPFVWFVPYIIHTINHTNKRTQRSCSSHDILWSHRMDSNICGQALHLMYTDTGLWPRIRQNSGNLNVHNFVTFVSQYLNYNLNISNILKFGILHPKLCICVCTLSYWRIPQEGSMAPKK